MSLDVFLHASAGTINLHPGDAERIRCFYYITQLDSRGLGKAVQSLRDMVEFYAEEPLPPLLAPPARSVTAKVGRSYTSTVPPFAEE